MVQVDKATPLFLPSRSAITRALNISNQTTSLPLIARDKRHFEISDRFKQFCLFNSGKHETELILIFGDFENRNAIKLYKRTCFVDGTFFNSPFFNSLVLCYFMITYLVGDFRARYLL